MKPRYASDAAWWLLHDAIVHPLTGLMGALGRLCGSYRVMALAHHIHNATAPSNDAMADYADAAYRAGCNESPGDPNGRKTPDEQRWEREAACRAIGQDPATTYLTDQEVYDIQQKHDLPTWRTQASGGHPPVEESATAVAQRQRIEAAERSIAAHLGAERGITNAEMLVRLLEVMDSVLEAREKHTMANKLRHAGIAYVPKNWRASEDL